MSEKHGLALLLDPRATRGTSFSNDERDRLGLVGLLPHAVETVERQIERVRGQLDRKPNDLERYVYMTALLDRDEGLLYRVVRDDPERLLPIIYAPTVGEACLSFDHIYRRPRGMYVTLEHKGRIAEVLRNWPEQDVRFVCVTTGGRILGLGDIGANGMGIPIGKLQLYTACAGVPPQTLLPLMLDIGTTNAALRADPLYLGLRHAPPGQDELDGFVEEFVAAVGTVFPDACIHFEDWKGSDALRYLDRYRERVLCYNDDIQGTAAVVLAGITAALKIKRERLVDQRFLFFGAGSAAIGIGGMLATAMVNDGLAEDAARARISLFDSRGLIRAGRAHVNAAQQPFAHDGKPAEDLLAAVEAVEATALIGVSTVGGAFTEPVIRKLASREERPIVFALSNPTENAEATAEQVYRWSDGRALFAAGVQFDPVTVGERTLYPGQANNSYIFPAIGLAVYAARPERIDDAMFVVAARAVADQVGPDLLARGMLYPSQRDIFECELTTAARLFEWLFDECRARVARPADIRHWLEDLAYRPSVA